MISVPISTILRRSSPVARAAPIAATADRRLLGEMGEMARLRRGADVVVVVANAEGVAVKEAKVSIVTRCDATKASLTGRTRPGRR